jgi:hypothetical protein
MWGGASSRATRPAKADGTAVIRPAALVASVASAELGPEGRSLVLSLEGANVAGVVTATDAVGNVEQYASPAVSIHRTPPVVSAPASLDLVASPYCPTPLAARNVHGLSC